MRAIPSELEAGLTGKAREDRALAILALLSGGMSIAHAVPDSRLGARAASAVVKAISELGETGSNAR